MVEGRMKTYSTDHAENTVFTLISQHADAHVYVGNQHQVLYGVHLMDVDLRVYERRAHKVVILQLEYVNLQKRTDSW